MNIELEKAKNEFMEYIKQYNLTEEKIKRKVGHSLRVMEISRKIAKSLKLEQEMVELATLIGLLHDIGRFKQFETYQTFIDELTIDHAELGVEILKKDNLIRKFIKEDKYDSIIMKAIYNHNKFEIEERLNEKEEIFAKIIRDADKIDIFYEAETMFWNDRIEIIETGICSEKVYNEFMKCQCMDRRKCKTEIGIEKVVQVVTFIFDINYKKSLEIMKEKNYVENIFNRFNFKHEKTRKQVEQINETVKQYINNKLKMEETNV